MMTVAEKLKIVSEETGVAMIYKSSFQKDNRSSVDYYQGPGLDEGLRILQKVKDEFGFPLISDIHYPDQVSAAAEVLDVIQIPAYLCMQTGLVTEAAKTQSPSIWRTVQFRSGEHDQAGTKSRIYRQSQDHSDRTRLHLWIQRSGGGSPFFPSSGRVGLSRGLRCHAFDQEIRHPKCRSFRRCAAISECTRPSCGGRRSGWLVYRNPSCPSEALRCGQPAGHRSSEALS